MPLASEKTVRSTPVAWLRTTIETPGVAPPWGSVIVPRSVPVDCADAVAAAPASRVRTRNHRAAACLRLRISLCPPSSTRLQANYIEGTVTEFGYLGIWLSRHFEKTKCSNRNQAS